MGLRPERGELVRVEVRFGVFAGAFTLDDRLAAAARSLPRLPAALENNALGDLLVGVIDVQELAARAGRSADEMRAALEEVGLDQFLPGD